MSQNVTMNVQHMDCAWRN